MSEPRLAADLAALDREPSPVRHSWFRMLLFEYLNRGAIQLNAAGAWEGDVKVVPATRELGNVDVPSHRISTDALSVPQRNLEPFRPSAHHGPPPTVLAAKSKHEISPILLPSEGDQIEVRPVLFSKFVGRHAWPRCAAPTGVSRAEREAAAVLMKESDAPETTLEEESSALGDPNAAARRQKHGQISGRGSRDVRR